MKRRVNDIKSLLLDEQQCIKINKQYAINYGLNIAYGIAVIEKYSFLDKTKMDCFSKKTLSRINKKLVELGFIKHKTFEDIKDEVINIDKKYICEWCKCKCGILNKHHYPIPKRLGGTSIVNICPNCHNYFHSIERNSNLGWRKEI